jgi:hypothetical protein
MPDALILHYRLTRELWRSFLEAHYGRDRALRWRHLWGVACIVIACLGFGGFYASRVVAALLLATGFFGVLSKQLLVLRSLRRADRHPFSGRELTVAVSPKELSVRSSAAGYAQPWQNFIGYRRLAPGFLLYHDRDDFFCIPASSLTAGYARRLEQILAAAEVPEL